MTGRRASILACLGLVVVWVAATLTVLAQEASPPASPADASIAAPASESIDAAITRLENDQDIEQSVKDQALELLQTAKKRVEETRAQLETMAGYQQAIDQGPAQLAEVQRTIGGLQGDAAAQVQQEFSEVEDLKQIEDALLRAQGEQTALAGRVAELDGQLRDLQARPERIRVELAEEQKALEDLERQAAETPDASVPGAVRDAQRESFTARRQYRQARINRLRLEQLSYDRRLELRRAQRELEGRRLTAAEARVRALQELVNQKRVAQAQRLQREAEQAQRQARRGHPLVQEIADANARLSQAATTLAADLKRVSEEVTKVEADYALVADEYESTRRDLEDVGVSEFLAQVLREQRRQLAQHGAARMNPEARRTMVAERNIERINYSKEHRAIDSPEEREQRAADIAVRAELAVDEAQRQEIRSQALAALEARATLLEAYLRTSQDLLAQLKELEIKGNQLARVLDEYAAFLDEHLLWTRSAPPLWLQPLAGYAEAVAWPGSAVMRQEAVGVLLRRFREAPQLFLLTTLLFVLLFAMRRRLLIKLEVIAGQVRQVYSDRYWLTWQALFIAVMLALPLSLLLAFIGWQLRIGAAAERALFAHAVGQALLAGAAVIFPIRLARQILRDSSLAMTHFRWRETPVRLLRFHVRWLWMALGGCVFITTIAEAAPEDVVSQTLGRAGVVAGSIVVAIFFMRTLRASGGVIEMVIGSRRAATGRLRFFAYWIAVLAPLALAMFAILGYVYTSVVLGMRGLATIAVLGLAVVAHQMALRWLFVAQRRLAIARARQKREAAQAQQEADAAGEETPVVVEEQEIDLATINEHTRQLLTTLAFIILLVGLWLIWAEALPALNALNERVQVWEGVTLANLVVMGVILVVTWLAARNVPGVLEIAVLEKLALDAGSRYAAATITSYVIVGIGLSMAVKAIGFSWTSVQWLVAALGVGLGFGLQEIVANFVSGLILLFERPIRVGDIVQVGDVTGTVTRIRIRATTITNWDRHELVVPNKEFITGRMLNWTLSNTINRIVISVGVAYGSNPEQVREIIYRVIRANPLILTDPAPMVVFDGYGDNALTFAVRCFLPDFDNRQETIHQLHTKIYEALNEADIAIAFPQRDVHLDTSRPLELRLIRDRHKDRARDGERTRDAQPVGEGDGA